MQNPCLRPASMSDVLEYIQWTKDEESYRKGLKLQKTLQKLYNFEWQKRGFERSP